MATLDTRQFRKFAASLDAESIRPELAGWRTIFTSAAMTIRHLADRIDFNQSKPEEQESNKQERVRT